MVRYNIDGKRSLILAALLARVHVHVTRYGTGCDGKLKLFVEQLCAEVVGAAAAETGQE